MQRVARITLVAAVLLAGGCAYLSEKQGELIFRPSKQAWRGVNGADRGFQEHWIAVGDEQKLHAWWLEGNTPDAPAVLYLHGARWNLTGSVTRIERWRELGFAVLAVDYRGFGESSDVAPTEALAYEDAEAAWGYLARTAPGRKRYIVGHSLGGAIAAARTLPSATEDTFTSVSLLKRAEPGLAPLAYKR